MNEARLTSIHQIMLCPHTVLSLVDALIERGHVAFKGKKSVLERKASARVSLHERYRGLAGEDHIPEDQREGVIHGSIWMPSRRA